MKRITQFISLLAITVPMAASASSMTYEPINPNFGGNPNNANGLMANATAQRQFEKKSTSSTSSSARSLNNLVINGIASRLTNQITDTILDPNSVDSGTFSLGDGSSITYAQDGTAGTVTVTIVGADGQTTTVIVPLS